jgi:hypothetical protein
LSPVPPTLPRVPRVPRVRRGRRDRQVRKGSRAVEVYLEQHTIPVPPEPPAHLDLPGLLDPPARRVLRVPRVPLDLRAGQVFRTPAPRVRQVRQVQTPVRQVRRVRPDKPALHSTPVPLDPRDRLDLREPRVLRVRAGQRAQPDPPVRQAEQEQRVRQAQPDPPVRRVRW